jgi:hypothetical protein
MMVSRLTGTKIGNIFIYMVCGGEAGGMNVLPKMVVHHGHN